MLSLSIINDVAEITALEPFVEQITDAFSLDMGLSFQLQLVLDEAVSNVVHYAYGEAKGMPITINADLLEDGDGRQLTLTITDEGMEFNPLEQAPEVDTTLSAEEREIGGLGIFLIRQTMDDVIYERKENKNIFTMVKSV